MIKTFNEWSRAGYKINKGAKAIGRNGLGVPVFSSDQVQKSTQFNIDYNDPDYEGSMEEALGNWDWYKD
jgi:hypothetical protein